LDLQQRAAYPPGPEYLPGVPGGPGDVVDPATRLDNGLGDRLAGLPVYQLGQLGQPPREVGAPAQQPVPPLREAEPGPPGGRLAGPADRGGDLRRPGDREPAHLLAAGWIGRDQLAVLDDGDAGRAGGGHDRESKSETYSRVGVHRALGHGARRAATPPWETSRTGTEQALGRAAWPGSSAASAWSAWAPWVPGSSRCSPAPASTWWPWRSTSPPWSAAGPRSPAPPTGRWPGASSPKRAGTSCSAGSGSPSGSPGCAT